MLQCDKQPFQKEHWLKSEVLKKHIQFQTVLSNGPNQKRVEVHIQLDIGLSWLHSKVNYYRSENLIVKIVICGRNYLFHWLINRWKLLGSKEYSNSN